MRTIILRELTFDECFGILGALGCGDDPVIYDGRATSVSSLEQEFMCRNDGRKPTERMRIKFWGGTRKLRRIHGTLRDLVKDRLTP